MKNKTLAAWLALVAVVLLCGALSLYWAAAGYLYVRFRERDLGWGWRALAFGACVLLAELARAGIGEHADAIHLGDHQVVEAIPVQIGQLDIDYGVVGAWSDNC